MTGLLRALFPRFYRRAYLDGVAAADAEWAVMLEMHMVGPVAGHTTHPIRGRS